MSVDATSWAWQQTTGKSTAKAVLLALADRAGADNTAWPSMATIAKDTEQNRKTVNASLRLLIAGGFIEDTGMRKGSTGKVVVYRLIGVNNRHEDQPNKQYRKRNSTENGTVCDDGNNKPENATTKQAQKRNSTENGTVPNLPANSTENGTLNSTENGTQNLPVEPISEPLMVEQGVNYPSEVENPPTSNSNLDRLFQTDATLQTAAHLKNQKRFPMHFEWMPRTSFPERCKASGVLIDQLTLEQQENILGEFRSYWEGRGDVLTQGGWEHKLLSQIKYAIADKQTGKKCSHVSDFDHNDNSWVELLNDPEAL
ncbi:helix-turn-helix domain-containing protein [Neptuniibacter sp.]|uniref:DnaT-like ssDNA-binding domain-containing protein n=1 Tax=Neptuniibacter sp. TaxID=1962643 RepID=UPI0026390C9F|nr:helix-turn-helix domain-containing protein [Neptuniibacter sp.]MCP4596161.1 hypothetical protein [Neptuniibacter sp.]